MRASYLWQRGTRYWFQITPPRGLHHALGRSPLRLRLPVSSARDARRFARVLAGQAEAEFETVASRFFDRAQDEEVFVEPDEPPEASTYEFCRDATMRSLQRAIDTLHASSATGLTKAGIHFADGRSRPDTAARQVVQDWKSFAQKTSARCADYWGQIQTLTEKVDAQALFYDDLHRDFLDEAQMLYSTLSNKDAESGELRAIIQTATSNFEEKKRAFEDRINGLQHTTLTLSEQQIRINDKVFKVHKTLRQAGDEFLAAKKEVLQSTSKEYAYLVHRLDLFIALVGDYPLDHYKLEHLTRSC